MIACISRTCRSLVLIFVLASSSCLSSCLVYTKESQHKSNVWCDVAYTVAHTVLNGSRLVSFELSR